MGSYANDRLKIIFCLLVASGWLGAQKSAYANDVIIDGLSCNDLCQSWMGYSKTTVLVKNADRDHTFHHSHSSFAAAPTLNIHQSSTPTRAEIRDSVRETDIRKSHRRIILADHSQPETQKSRSLPPLPIIRPALEGSSRAVIAGDPLPLISHASPPLHKATKSNVLPNVNLSPASSLLSPTITGKLGKPNPMKFPQNTTSNRAVPVPAASSLLPQTPHVVTFPPVNNTTSPPVNTSAAFTISPAVGILNKSSTQQTHARSAGPSSPALIFQTIPELADNPWFVTVDYVSTKNNNAYVHVILANTLPNDLKDVDIRCIAINKQEKQVGEGYLHVDDITPSSI